MAKKHGPNKENLEATRRIFLQIARKEFSTQGYYNASTAQIVEESGMARGSLYYHFGDKKGLFRAVYEELMYEMRDDILEKIADKNDPWDAFISACLRCLDLLMQPQTRRIIVDVHTALTYGERVEILQRTLLEQLGTLLQGVLAAGYFKGHNPRSLGTLIFGILSEGGRSFELADNVPKAREDIGNAFVLLMEKASA
jgi:AcrR family transcriptional regulator